MFRRTAVALAIAGAWLLAPVSVYSDTDLTGLVNSAYFPRTESAELHAIAHQRAVEISTNFSHDGMRPGMAEVLAYNGLGAARAVEQWIASPSHHAILSDPAFREIGCGSHIVGDVYFAACVLTWGDSPPPQAPVPAPPAEVPIQSGEPVVAARSPKPTPVGSTPTAGATPVLLPNTATEP